MSNVLLDPPWACRLLPLDMPIEAAEHRAAPEVCPLIAVTEGKDPQGLVVRHSEMMWWPLNRVRVIEEITPIDPEEGQGFGDSEVHESLG